MEITRKPATSVAMKSSLLALAAALMIAGTALTAHAQTSELISWTVAETGDPYPEVDGETYESFGPPVQDGFGVLFRAEGEGGTDGIIDFRNRATDATPLVTNASPAPGGGTYDSFDSILIAADDQSDHVAFVATVGGEQGLFLHDGSSDQHTVASQGDAIPGTTSTIGAISHLAFADGRIIFAATLNPGGAGDPEEGVYMVSAVHIIAGTGTMETVFDTVTEVPGATGGTFSEFHALSARGKNIAAIASTTTARKVAALHSTGTSQQRVLAATGDPVPGGTGTFADFTALDVTEGIVGVATVNDSGGVLLYLYTVWASLTERLTGTTTLNSELIPLSGTNTGLHQSALQLPLGLRERQVAISAKFVTTLTELPGEQLGIHWGLIGGTQLHKLTATGNPFDGGTVNNLEMTDKSLDGGRASLKIGVTDGGMQKDLLRTYRIFDYEEFDGEFLMAGVSSLQIDVFNGASTPGGITFVGENPSAFELRGKYRDVDPNGSLDAFPFTILTPQPDPAPEVVPVWNIEWLDEEGQKILDYGPHGSVTFGLLDELINEDTGMYGYDTSAETWIELNTWVDPATGQIRMDLPRLNWLTTGKDLAPKPEIPALGKIPLLNSLFFHVISSRKKEELLVLVTPRLITEDRSPSMVHPLAAPANLDNGWAPDPSIEIEEVEVGRYVITWSPTGDQGFLKIGVNP